MAMMPMLDLVPEIVVDIPNCPNPVALRALRDTMMDFCRRSESWIVYDDFAVTVASQPDVVLNLLDNTRIVKILSLTHNGTPLQPASEKVLDNQIHSWRSEEGIPRAFFEMLGNKVRLYPIPEETKVGLVKGSIALAPTRSATEMDEDLVDNWLEGIVAGAQHRLMMMPNQPWTDPNRAGPLYGLYETTVGHAMRYSRNDHQSKPSRVTSYGGY